MTKAELHELVDALPDGVNRLRGCPPAASAGSGLAKLDAAPYDDEAFTDHDRVAVDSGMSEPGVQWSEVSSELTSG